MKKIGAFFDIDGTLARESMLIQHFKRLIKYGIIDESEWFNRIRPLYREYDRRYAEYDDYLDEVADVYKEYITGLDKAIIDFTAKQVVEEYADVVYQATRNRIQNHMKKGHLTFFVSGSPDFLVSKLAEKYGVTDYRATVYETDEKNRFTGRITPMWDSDSKSKVLKAIENDYQIDMEESYAYGDTNGDYSMLKLTGKPTAINPSYRLWKLIEEDQELSKKIVILVERKDVIYKLSGDTTIKYSMSNPYLPKQDKMGDDDWELK